MSEDFEEGAFLGLPRGQGPADVAVVPLAYELTTSYGTGACDGPQACVEASAQVELYDDRLGDDLPAGLVISTEPVWEGTAPTLRAQLDELAAHAASFYNGDQFPLFLGGEHGILPPIMHAAR
ncbi:MAG: arginase family protein, partial [Poseidonia sp.]